MIEFSGVISWNENILTSADEVEKNMRAEGGSDVYLLSLRVNGGREDSAIRWNVVTEEGEEGVEAEREQENGGWGGGLGCRL